MNSLNAMRFRSGVFAATLGLGVAAPAPALEAFCTHVDFCALVPYSGGVPVYNHPDLAGFNPALPWVIGGTTVVNLSAGTYTAGNSAFGPSVFVIEDGTLAADDQSADVALPAHLFLCDNATFRVRNSTWRTNAPGPFTYGIWADGSSQVDYLGASLASLDATLEAQNLPGALLQVMQGQSTLTVTPTAAGQAGAEMVRFGDAWELAVTEAGTADVNAFWGFAETYVAGNANFSMAESFFFDVFFEICPGATQNLPALPELCSLTAVGLPPCISATHAPISFSVGPPNTTFTLNLVNDRVFSWALSTYPGSVAALSNVGVDANLAIGLGSLTGVLNVRAVPGNPPVLTGVTDRTVTLSNTTVGVWHLWPGTGVDLTLADSSVGDFSLPADGLGRATASYFAFGALTVPTGAQMRLADAAINEPVDLRGSIWMRNTVVGNVFTVAGNAWCADSPLVDNGSLDLRPGGRYHTLSLAQPVDGTVITTPADVMGSVDAVDTSGTLSPFPGAVLELRNGSTVLPVATITAPVTQGVLAQLDPNNFPAGEHQLRLAFAGAGAEAYAERTVTLVHMAMDGGTGMPDAGGSQSSSAASSASSSAATASSSTGGAASSAAASSSSSSSSSSAASSASSMATNSSGGGSSSASTDGGGDKRNCACASTPPGMPWYSGCALLVGGIALLVQRWRFRR